MGVLGEVACEGVLCESLDPVDFAPGGEELEATHPQVAASDSGQEGAWKQCRTPYLFAGGDHGQPTSCGYA